jgi:hypothetical protein
MSQYLLLGLLFIPSYASNEWILLDGGLGIISHGSFVDTGAQIKGIFITVVLALVGGLRTGQILALTGRRETPYIDAEEFELD